MLRAFFEDKKSSGKLIDKKLYRPADTTTSSLSGKTTFKLRFP